ncbi:MAG TPA: radical SAM family heme chaperone HemW [Pyrinomonadaceae bacterium]|nr:radical SAM family heme chaperone HemW [Pyrinomonadaceae bacterium]
MAHNLFNMMHAGVYIHIPFCRSRCSYCDFATGMYEGELAERYVSSVITEISKWSEVETPSAADTIYFGGGTPSLLTPLQIERILKAVHDRFDVINGAEVTMEMNPASISSSDELSSQKLREFRRLGINRASFGAQTFDDRELKQLGRTHTAADIPSTFDRLREAGFENINFDLIAGLPNQTLSGWKRNLDEALKLRPDHLSLYLLDVHEGTPLADQIRRRMRPTPDDDLAGEMYQLMLDEVCAAGYEHYEISNFCLPGFGSRHNTKYWNGAAYYGFGCSAHSYDGWRRRWANERDVAKYVTLVEKERSPIAERTNLNQEDARSESIFLGLRLMRGLDLDDYRTRFGSDLLDRYDADLSRLREAGLIEIDEGLMRLTRRGALLSNEVFAVLA